MAQLSSRFGRRLQRVRRNLAGLGRPRRSRVCVRAASTRSRARCRTEIPGVAIASSRVASDSEDEPASIRHCASDPVQFHDDFGLGNVSQGLARDSLGLIPVGDAIERVSEPGGEAVTLDTCRGTRRRPE